MIYEHLGDNHVPLNEVGRPKIRYPCISNIFSPSMLRVNKQINAEFTPLCLSIATLCFVYYGSDLDDYGVPVLSILTQSLEIRVNVLDKIQHLKFKVELDHHLPDFSEFEVASIPQSAILRC